MGFPTVFTLTLISSSIIFLLLAGPANGINVRINLASTLGSGVPWPWPFDDSKTNYTLFEVDPAKTPDKLLYFVGISLIGQSDEEVKKLDSRRCVDTSLLDSFVTLMQQATSPIPVFHERILSVTLGDNHESIILKSPLVNKTYGNARSVSLRAGGGTFVLQVMRELAEPEKMDIFILSRNRTLQLEPAILTPLTTELSDTYSLNLTYLSCDTSGGEDKPINPSTNGGNNQPENPSTNGGNNQLTIEDDKQSTVQSTVEQSTILPPIDDDKQSPASPPIDTSTPKTAESSNSYKLQPTSVLILLSISRFRSVVSYLLQ